MFFQDRTVEVLKGFRSIILLLCAFGGTAVFKDVGKLLDDLIEPLKEREKSVNSLIKAADDLQRNVYQVAPSVRSQ